MKTLVTSLDRLIGRPLVGARLDGERVILVGEDSYIIFVARQSDYDDSMPEIEICSSDLNDHYKFDLGILSDDELDEILRTRREKRILANKERLLAERKARRAQYELLKKEFEPEQ